MNKYFEKNIFADKDKDFKDVQGTLWRAFQTLSHNVEVKDAMPHLRRKCIEGRETAFDENLAGSALMMIAACEALLSKLEPEIVEKAGVSVKEKIAKEPNDKLKDLLRAAFGIE